jgi:ribosomal subunit interface protein
MRQDANAEPLAVDFRGAIPEKVKEYATEKLSKLERYAPRPILHTKFEIHEEGNPAIATPWAAKASMDVNGDVLHASVSGKTPEEAIDLLADRLRRQIERVHDAHDSKPSHRGGHEKVPAPAVVPLEPAE